MKSVGFCLILFYMIFTSSQSFGNSYSDKEMPSDFYPFYEKFRDALYHGSQPYKLICFPFETFDNGEIPIDGVERTKIDRDTFIKNRLDLFFLDLNFRTFDMKAGVGLKPIPIYTSSRDLIIRNPKPSHIANVDFDILEVKNNFVRINGVEFKKRESGWCWSGSWHEQSIKEFMRGYKASK
ncbi:hypothetical protein HNQ59_003924 [Chitinivorax tropicus]|uniref:Uncharacterized protein n=1 Tax=Chitinivorax tropicus TaxID=714531 RepID=A0A840MU40_9PROT|nr:hypothetical protein [Chitinivorax tropicus]MBB5020599.1 hypothetical protein [Chitinivorax tropicus]